MRFWDSSAVVPLLVQEAATEQAQTMLAEDSDLLVWWATPVECVSALARREREGTLPVRQLNAALARLARLQAHMTEVEPADPVRAAALRLLRVHALRAADALQLAAAVVASEGHPDRLPLVTYDQRLRQAAGREGFLLLPDR